MLRKFWKYIVLVLSVIILYAILGDRSYDYNQFPIKDLHTELTRCPHREGGFVTTSFLTLQVGAGIGNQLFELFSILGIARKLNRTAIFNADDYELDDAIANLQRNVPGLVDMFQFVQLTADTARYPFNQVMCCMHWNERWVECDNASFLFLDGTYFQSFKYFDGMRSEIRSLLSPEQYRYDQSSRKLCVHIRRGDFLSDGMHRGSDPEFVMKAIRLLFHKNNHLKEVVFIGNDPKWTRENFESLEQKITILDTPKEKAVEDIHYSSQNCHSFLISSPSSTFAWWLAYSIDNQENVFYRDIEDTSDLVQYHMRSQDFYPPQWNKISAGML